MAEIKEVNDKTFSDIDPQRPAVIMFGAPWCAPCKVVKPHYNQIAEESKGDVDFYTVNVDDSPALCSKFSVRGVPLMLALKNGEVVDQVVGAVPKKVVKGLVEKLIK